MAGRESFVATEKGVELVDARRIQRGWSRTSPAFAQKALVGVSTLKRFWQRKLRLDRDSMAGIFAAVGIESWRDYVESNEVEVTILNDPLNDALANGATLPRLPDNLPNYYPFLGRSTELGQLEQYVLPQSDQFQNPDESPKRYQVINLWGLGGIGKSALAEKLTRRLSSEFEGVLWRSMQSAPALNEFLADLLSELTGELADPASSRLLNDFTKQLQRRQILLVFDGWEVFFGGASAGAYQELFQGYRRLLSHLWQHPHQSCVLVTSRERLADASLLGASVVSYPVRALERQDAFQLLRLKGLSGFDQQAGEQLVRTCSGNPLALQLVASRIRDHFNGNIADFLTEAPELIDESMRSILDQQTRSLSRRESQILVALAQDPEPVDREALAARLIEPCSTSDLVNSLSSLEKRSLIERTTDLGPALYGLQPLVRKYVLATGLRADL